MTHKRRNIETDTRETTAPTRNSCEITQPKITVILGHSQKTWTSRPQPFTPDTKRGLCCSTDITDWHIQFRANIMLVLSLITFSTVQNQRWWSAMNLLVSNLEHGIKHRDHAVVVDVIRRASSHSLRWKHTWQKNRFKKRCREEHHTKAMPSAAHHSTHSINCK